MDKKVLKDYRKVGYNIAFGACCGYGVWKAVDTLGWAIVAGILKPCITKAAKNGDKYWQAYCDKYGFKYEECSEETTNEPEMKIGF